jgi:hypothetical protein
MFVCQPTDNRFGAVCHGRGDRWGSGGEAQIARRSGSSAARRTKGSARLARRVLTNFPFRLWQASILCRPSASADPFLIRRSSPLKPKTPQPNRRCACSALHAKASPEEPALSGAMGAGSQSPGQQPGSQDPCHFWPQALKGRNSLRGWKRTVAGLYHAPPGLENPKWIELPDPGRWPKSAKVSALPRL